MKSFQHIIEYAMPGKPESHERRLTWNEISELRKHLDELWKKLGIDVSFTHHFMERVNDPRNKKQITISELSKLFTDVYKTHGAQISAKVKPGTDHEFEAVLTDLSTKVNLPVVLEWDRKSRQLKLVALTVMRKDNFFTKDPKLTVQHYEPENTMKSKTYTDLKEWIGFNTPEVAPMVAPQAVDDVDTAAHSIEQPDVLDKLNAYCHGIANHQYINPYYPLHALWRKLMLIGINFDLKSLMLIGDHGRVSVPLNQFGGRYGVLGTMPDPTGHDDGYVEHDDGISHRIPGGLKLTVTFQKIAGIYTLTAQIEHGSAMVGFGEEAADKPVKKK